MSVSVSFTELLDWVEGRLAPARAAEVAALVEGAGAETAATVDWIRRFHAAARVMPLEQPPAEASAALRTALRQYASAWDPGSFTDAVLTMDSREQRPMAGIRDTRASDDAVHLVFDTDLGRLALDFVALTEDRVDVYGGFTPPPDRAGGIRVVFTSRRRVRRVATCGTSGSFLVREVPVDVDEVWGVRGGDVIRIEVTLAGR